MSLSMLGIGEKAKIVGLNGRTNIKKHLTEIGFLLGKNIEIIQNTFGNNIIVAIEGTRMALDRRMAHRVDICLASKEADVNTNA